MNLSPRPLNPFVTLRLLLVLSALLCVFHSTYAKSQSQLLREFTASIYNEKEFAGYLPEKILVWLPESGLEPISQKGLKKLRPHTASRFIAFPVKQQPPAPTLRIPPLYPFSHRREGKEGDAHLMFLVNTKGEVANIYVVKATDREFGVAAARALAAWKFKPAMIDQVPVPVLTIQRITFTIKS